MTEFWAFLLAFARLTAMFAAAPIFGSRMFPRTAKAALAALTALILVPLVSPKLPPPPADLLSLVGRVGGEVVIGLCLGFLTQLILAAIQMAGHFIDTQIGFGIINILNPFSEQQTTPLGEFLQQLGMLLFLLAGGHLLLVGAVADSYAVVGPGAARLSGGLSDVFIGAVGQMFTLAFRIAVPAAAVLLVVDVAFAIIARTMPQMNVFLVGMPVKILLGLTTVALTLPVLAVLLGDAMSGWSAGAQAFLKAAR